MIKLFLVEDEIVMRNGIKKNIDWKAEGIEFVGDASDGELAYPMILKEKPDILLTDIKMPFMDGLELCELVRKELPDIKIIILSGYDDFSYAQKAVRLNVTEYLLKPISPDKLLASIRQVAKEIEESRGTPDYNKLSEWEQEERLKLEKQKFFGRMVKGKLQMTQILELGHQLGMELSAPYYQICLVHGDTTGGQNKVYSEGQNQMMEKVFSYVNQVEKSYYFDRGTEGFALLIMADEPQELEETRKNCIDGILKIITSYPQVEYFVGVGSVVQRLRELGDSYNDANKAFSYRYLTTTNQVIDSRKIDYKDVTANEVNIHEVNVNQMDRKIVLNFLKSGATDEVGHFVQDYFASMGSQNTRSTIFLQYVTMDVYFSVVAFLEEMGYKIEDVTEEYGDINEVIKRFSTLDRIEEYFVQVFCGALKLRDDVARKKYSTVLATAREYIDENYNCEDISLNTVAATVNVSPNHFSSIFSQEMGKTFIEYLTGIRMEKAKELLMTTNRKSSEIAYEIGYKDPHYFSFMFKKTQGCTAREYRAGKRG